MRWLVELLDIQSEQDLTLVLSHFGCRIVSAPNEAREGRFLSCGHFSADRNSLDVGRRANTLHEALQQSNRLYPSLRIAFSLGSVFEVRPDGSLAKRSDMASLELRMRQRRRQEESEAERKVTAEKAAKLAALVMKDEVAGKVMQLLQAKNPNPTQLGSIVELIEDACKGDLGALTSKAQRKRFTGSINHPKVMGLHARHAVRKHDPPPDPMTDDEARKFALTLARAWLEQRATARGTDG